jgi:hypothetical protein
MYDYDDEEAMHPALHDLFCSIGMISSFAVTYYFFGYVYPIPQVIADAAWQAHIVEARLTPYMRRVYGVLETMRWHIFPEPERKEVSLYKEGKMVGEYTMLDSRRADLPDHDVAIRRLIAEDGTSATEVQRRFCDLSDNININSTYILSATLDDGSSKTELESIFGKVGLAKGSRILTPGHLKQMGHKLPSDEKYTITLIDSNVNMSDLTTNTGVGRHYIMGEKGVTLSEVEQECDEGNNEKKNTSSCMKVKDD